jgi:hypothetical protein
MNPLAECIATCWPSAEQEVNASATFAIVNMAIHLGALRSATVWQDGEQMAIVRWSLDECYPTFAAMNH